MQSYYFDTITFSNFYFLDKLESEYHPANLLAKGLRPKVSIFVIQEFFHANIQKGEPERVFRLKNPADITQSANDVIKYISKFDIENVDEKWIQSRFYDLLVELESKINYSTKYIKNTKADVPKIMDLFHLIVADELKCSYFLTFDREFECLNNIGLNKFFTNLTEIKLLKEDTQRIPIDDLPIKI